MRHSKIEATKDFLRDEIPRKSQGVELELTKLVALSSSTKVYFLT